MYERVARLSYSNCCAFSKIAAAFKRGALLQCLSILCYSQFASFLSALVCTCTLHSWSNLLVVHSPGGCSAHVFMGREEQSSLISGCQPLGSRQKSESLSSTHLLHSSLHSAVCWSGKGLRHSRLVCLQFPFHRTLS